MIKCKDAADGHLPRTRRQHEVGKHRPTLCKDDRHDKGSNRQGRQPHEDGSCTFSAGPNRPEHERVDEVKLFFDCKRPAMQQRLFTVVAGKVVGGAVKVQDVCAHCQGRSYRTLEVCKRFCDQQVPAGYKERDQQAPLVWGANHIVMQTPKSNVKIINERESVCEREYE